MPRIVPRNIAASLGFNGSTTRITATAISGLASAHSITGWVFPNRVQAGDHRVIANNIESSSSLETVTLNTDLSIRAGYYNGTVYTRSSSTPLTANQWSFFVYTWNGTSATLTINGVSQIGNIAPQSNTSVGLNIGARSDGTTLINGGLSEIRYFNRAISSDEGMALYTANIVPSGCVREYLLNEGSGTTATDTSASAVNGTITSPVWSSTNVPLRSRQADSGRTIPTKSRQPIGELVYNGDFEYAPPFTAATSVTQRWIDGTAAGSATNSVFGWAVFTVIGTVGASFDSTIPISGTMSLKLSTITGGAKIEVSNLPTNSAANTQKYGISVLPSTSYTATIKIRTANNGGVTASTGAFGAFMDVVERTASGGFVVSNTSSGIRTTTSAQTYTIAFTTGATTRFITPKCVIDGSGGAATLTMDAWFDDFEIRTTTPTTRQLIT